MLTLVTVPGCDRRSPVDGTFIQPWAGHVDWTAAQWLERLARIRQLGGRDVVLQWSGLYGGTSVWSLAPSTLLHVLDHAQTLGMTVVIGLPYDERWWTVLNAPDDAPLRSLLAGATDQAARAVETFAGRSLPAFRGWYIPYELEQYNWSSPARRAMLLPWLQAMVRVTATPGAAPLALSTYFSQIPSSDTLASLWSAITDDVAVRPMIQDGVGVAGMANLTKIDPVCAMLRRKGVAFDLIVELFEELPASVPGGFNARSARFDRVHAQLAWARSQGAGRVMTFAVDPWLLADDAHATALRLAWQAAYGPVA